MDKCEHNFNPVTRICTKCNQHIYDALEDYDDSEDDFECCGESVDDMEEKETKWLAGFIECDLCGSIYLCCYHIETEKTECKVCGNMARFERRTLEEWKNAPVQKRIK